MNAYIQSGTKKLRAKSQSDPTCDRRMNYEPSSWRWPAGDAWVELDTHRVKKP
jgi:hypothetical protein